MADTPTPILLIDRGDLPALTAALMQPDTSRLILWHAAEADAAAARREAIVQEHAALLGSRGFVEVPAVAPRGLLARDPGLFETLLLVHAAIAARDHDAAKIIWPVQGGIDPDTICRRVDRATAVTDLADVSPRPTATGSPEIVVDLPLVDLDDDQVVDLADDAGAPWGAFWPCDLGGARPCSDCPGCRRWRTAFERRGLPAPWEPAATHA